MAEDAPNLTRRILRVPAEIVVALFMVLDAIVSPLFGPPMRWLSSLKPVQRLERAMASLNPYVILALLVVPFGFAELAKVYAVIRMGEGNFRSGMTIFISAYVVSILGCERIFHAGKVPLMRIGWFKMLYDWVMMLRDHILAWCRRTRVWTLAIEIRQGVQSGLHKVGSKLRALFGPRPKDALERH